MMEELADLKYDLGEDNILEESSEDVDFSDLSFMDAKMPTFIKDDDFSGIIQFVIGSSEDENVPSDVVQSVLSDSLMDMVLDIEEIIEERENMFELFSLVKIFSDSEETIKGEQNLVLLNQSNTHNNETSFNKHLNIFKDKSSDHTVNSSIKWCASVETYSSEEEVDIISINKNDSCIRDKLLSQNNSFKNKGRKRNCKIIPEKITHNCYSYEKKNAERITKEGKNLVRKITKSSIRKQKRTKIVTKKESIKSASDKIPTNSRPASKESNVLATLPKDIIPNMIIRQKAKVPVTFIIRHNTVKSTLKKPDKLSSGKENRESKEKSPDILNRTHKIKTNIPVTTQATSADSNTTKTVNCKVVETSNTSDRKPKIGKDTSAATVKPSTVIRNSNTVLDKRKPIFNMIKPLICMDAQEKIVQGLDSEEAQRNRVKVLNNKIYKLLYTEILSVPMEPSPVTGKSNTVLDRRKAPFSDMLKHVFVDGQKRTVKEITEMPMEPSPVTRKSNTVLDKRKTPISDMVKPVAFVDEQKRTMKEKPTLDKGHSTVISKVNAVSKPVISEICKSTVVQQVQQQRAKVETPTISKEYINASNKTHAVLEKRKEIISKPEPVISINVPQKINEDDLIKLLSKEKINCNKINSKSGSCISNINDYFQLLEKIPLSVSKSSKSDKKIIIDTLKHPPVKKGEKIPLLVSKSSKSDKKILIGTSKHPPHIKNSEKISARYALQFHDYCIQSTNINTCERAIIQQGSDKKCNKKEVMPKVNKYKMSRITDLNVTNVWKSLLGDIPSIKNINFGEINNFKILDPSLSKSESLLKIKVILLRTLKKSLSAKKKVKFPEVTDKDDLFLDILNGKITLASMGKNGHHTEEVKEGETSMHFSPEHTQTYCSVSSFLSILIDQINKIKNDKVDKNNKKVTTTQETESNSSSPFQLHSRFMSLTSSESDCDRARHFSSCSSSSFTSLASYWYHFYSESQPNQKYASIGTPSPYSDSGESSKVVNDFPKSESHHSRSPSPDYGSRSRHRSRSHSRRHRSRSHSRHSSERKRNCHQHHESNKDRRQRNEEKERQIRERRVVYVGNLPDDITEVGLHHYFGKFGKIQNVNICYIKDATYGFVAFQHHSEAQNAIENGSKDATLSKFRLGFGGRRQFCEYPYEDPDSLNNDKKRKMELDYDTLLKEAQKDLKKRKR